MLKACFDQASPRAAIVSELKAASVTEAGLQSLKVSASFPSPQQMVVLVPYFSFTVFPHFMVISATW